ncbi:MAG TPA: hypothetical protein VMZ92_10740 [Planctomycetota bacterium]|nr:hypothetical protein [Planctomycetota bacterium]
MSKVTAGLCLLFLVLFVTCPVHALPTPEELLKMMADKAATVKTYEVDYVMDSTITLVKTGSTHHMVSLREERDGQVVHKFLITSRSTIRIGGNSTTMESKTVNDGEFWWHEIRSSRKPGVTVQKLKARKTVETGKLTNPEGVEKLRTAYDIADIEEDTIDGHKVFVLKATRKPEQGRTPETREYQEDLTVRRTVMRHPENFTVIRSDYGPLKLNAPVDPKLFEYTPPADAQIIDKTEDEPAQ